MADAPSLALRLERAGRAVRSAASHKPVVGLVLGSGLGAFADVLDAAVPLPYAEIPGMPVSTVEGHAGRLVLGVHAGVPVVAMQGRVHLYEGHAPDEVVFGVRLMMALGARTLVLTNAAGGIREGLEPGDLMLIEDHLNLTGFNCLAGLNDPAVGPRFVQLSDAYDPGLRALALRVAEGADLKVQTGVYAGLLGPTYETKAEVRMLRTLGADAVGMSTVLETIAARHMGARCLAISCITNRAAGLSLRAPDHAEVQATAAAASERFSALLSGVLQGLGRGVAS
jgi:purine-nucleoside phosphorylase